MILDNTNRDYINDQEEDTIKMSISADVQSHIIRVMTENSYDDALGSAIRECVSNAVDSVTEAGTGIPVIVSIKKNVANQWEFSVEDKGLGLDDASFKKYIMGLGESTKRNSSVLLGGFGAGAKAWLAYTDSFTYLCRKDGVERKYMIFKGPELPESTLLYEKPTTEPNGVTVSVLLDSNWGEVDTCKNKIREQLCYLDNVYYDIAGFNNSYNIYKSEDFQFSDMNGSNGTMHISLKNIRYEIDWAKLGKKPIYIPVALKFDSYDELKPIFNRESIVYTEASITALKNKIEKVAEYLIDKWNETSQVLKNLRWDREKIIYLNKTLSLFEHTFDLSDLPNHCTKQFVHPAIPEFKLRDAYFYANKKEALLNEWEATAYDSNKVWKKKHLNYEFSHVVFNAYAFNQKEVVMVNYPVVGNVKEYLRQKYSGKPTMYIQNTRRVPLFSRNFNCWHHILNLGDLPKEKWRAAIEEARLAISHYTSTFKDERNLMDTQVYKDWLDERKAAIKAGKIVVPASSKALDKQKDEITIYTGRPAAVGSGITFDKDKIKVENIQKTYQGKLNVYCLADETIPTHWVKALRGRINFFKFNAREVKHIQELKHFKTIKEFMQSKPLARIATALYIQELLELEPSNAVYGIEIFKEMKETKKRLEEYTHEQYVKFGTISSPIKSAILTDARERNHWDESIISDARAFEAEIKKYGFLSALKETHSWRTSETEKELIKKVVYVMLKHQRVTGKFLEDYDLVERPIVVEEPVVEETLEESIVEVQTENETTCA